MKTLLAVVALVTYPVLGKGMGCGASRSVQVQAENAEERSMRRPQTPAFVGLHASEDKASLEGDTPSARTLLDYETVMNATCISPRKNISGEGFLANANGAPVTPGDTLFDSKVGERPW